MFKPVNLTLQGPYHVSAILHSSTPAVAGCSSCQGTTGQRPFTASGQRSVPCPMGPSVCPFLLPLLQLAPWPDTQGRCQLQTFTLCCLASSLASYILTFRTVFTTATARPQSPCQPEINRRHFTPLSVSKINHLSHFGLLHGQALKAEVASQPHLLEASVFGYDDIYKRLRPFVERWRQLKAQQPATKVGHGCGGSARCRGGTRLNMKCIMLEATQGAAARGVSPPLILFPTSPPILSPPIPSCRFLVPPLPTVSPSNSLPPALTHPPPAAQQLYMVSVDVSRAFDSIDIQRLLGVVEPTLSSPCYTLLR